MRDDSLNDMSYWRPWSFGVNNIGGSSSCLFSRLGSLSSYKSLDGSYQFVLFYRQLTGAAADRYVHWHQPYAPTSISNTDNAGISQQPITVVHNPFLFLMP